MGKHRPLGTKNRKSLGKKTIVSPSPLLLTLTRLIVSASLDDSHSTANTSLIMLVFEVGSFTHRATVQVEEYNTSVKNELK